MQIKGLHKNIYRLADYALSQEKCEQQRKQYESCVWKWRKLKRSGLSDQDCQAIVGISRPTYYRYEGYLKELAKGIPSPSRKPKTFRKALWGESERQCVLKLRRENPTYGKAKIAVLLKRDEGITISESTVGRILKNLITRGLVQTSCSAPRRRKKHRLDLRKKAPFSISSIQVDGGSEFMKEFETACQELKIPLYVLPPKRPQYNGGVERGNRSFREEFYSQQNLLADSMQSLRYGLSKAVTKYNTYRPHFSLKGLTPMEYIQANYQRSDLSHS